MKACYCTNNCPTCGGCCQADCGHRRQANVYTTTGSTWPTLPKPLTKEEVRSIIREELDRRERGPNV